jgi:Protein of unknown function (DUF3011)
MSRRIFLITLGLLLMLPALGYAQATITCSSDNMRRNYCNIGENSKVRLLRQRSDARCIEGSTWGYNRNQIWVDRGCRADFEILPTRGGYGGGDRDRDHDGDHGRDWDRDRGRDHNWNGGGGGVSTVTCSSDNMRRNYCSVASNSRVRLLRQRSDARCVEGSTWGYSRNQIWVDRGCRADFEVQTRR